MLHTKIGEVICNSCLQSNIVYLFYYASRSIMISKLTIFVYKEIKANNDLIWENIEINCIQMIYFFVTVILINE